MDSVGEAVILGLPRQGDNQDYQSKEEGAEEGGLVESNVKTLQNFSIPMPMHNMSRHLEKLSKNGEL